MNFLRKNRSFTLVEIMIVVAIIAILSTIATAAIIRSRVNANETAAQAVIKSIIGAATIYQGAYGCYPAEIGFLVNDDPSYLDLPLEGGGTSSAIKYGYMFRLEGTTNTLSVIAEPWNPNVTGVRIFHADQTGEIVVQED